MQTLTEREQEVFNLIASEKSNPEIQEELAMSKIGLHRLLNVICMKAGLNHRRQLPQFIQENTHLIVKHPHKIGVVDYKSLVTLITNTFQRLYPEHRATDAQDMVQYFEAEIQRWRRWEQREK